MSAQNIDAAREALFGDALACDTVMPAALRADAPDTRTIERAVDHAEVVLRSLAMIEDSPHEDIDEHGNHDACLARVEAKLNLVLETLSGILRRDRADLPLQPVRWSRHGAVLQHSGEPPGRGFLVVQPIAWVPQRLELPVRLLASEAQGNGQHRVWLRFEPQPATLENALEKHLFRLHRRQLAHRKPA